MRIEEGKFYRTRDGRKVGPIEPWSYTDDWKWQGAGYLWDKNGVNFDGEGSRHDLVAEWTEHSPIRTETVTVRSLEPGVYGRLEVMFGVHGLVIGLTHQSTNKASYGTRLTAPELRELARVALEIAEYLDAQ